MINTILTGFLRALLFMTIIFMNLMFSQCATTDIASEPEYNPPPSYNVPKPGHLPGKKY
jgi:hypothetical protein